MLLGSAVVLVLVLSLNRLANPYCLFANDWVPHENKPETFSHSRLVKAHQVRHLRPAAVILGSSRAESGIDPMHPAWRHHPVYNLGLAGARIYEVMRYFQHACAAGEVREAVLVLDFFAFLEDSGVAKDFREDRLLTDRDGASQKGVSWTDRISSVLSWDACIASVRTLSAREEGYRHLVNGSRNTAYDIDRILARGGAAKAFEALRQGGGSLMPSNTSRLGEREKSCFRTILDQARKANIDLRIALGPTHVEYLEGVAAAGQWELFLEWMRAMVEIVEEEATHSAGVPFPLVDFNGYHEFNKERMPEKGVAQYYLDPFHFTPRLGSQMLDLLMGTPEPLKTNPPGSFGVLLNSSSIDVQIQAYRQHRA
jgi:hypothetical protein